MVVAQALKTNHVVVNIVSTDRSLTIKKIGNTIGISDQWNSMNLKQKQLQ